MIDLHEIGVMFEALVVPCELGYVARRVQRLFRVDDSRHEDADRWLAASDEERERMRPHFVDKLRRAIDEAARYFTPKPKRKRIFNPVTARARQKRFRDRQKEKGTPRWSTLTPEQRERQREYVRACRARKATHQEGK